MKEFKVFIRLKKDKYQSESFSEEEVLYWFEKIKKKYNAKVLCDIEGENFAFYKINEEGKKVYDLPINFSSYGYAFGKLISISAEYFEEFALKYFRYEWCIWQQKCLQHGKKDFLEVFKNGKWTLSLYLVYKGKVPFSFIYRNRYFKKNVPLTLENAVILDEYYFWCIFFKETTKEYSIKEIITVTKNTNLFKDYRLKNYFSKYFHNLSYEDLVNYKMYISKEISLSRRIIELLKENIDNKDRLKYIFSIIDNKLLIENEHFDEDIIFYLLKLEEKDLFKFDWEKIFVRNKIKVTRENIEKFRCFFSKNSFLLEMFLRNTKDRELYIELFTLESNFTIEYSINTYIFYDIELIELFMTKINNNFKYLNSLLVYTVNEEKELKEIALNLYYLSRFAKMNLKILNTFFIFFNFCIYYNEKVGFSLSEGSKYCYSTIYTLSQIKDEKGSMYLGEKNEENMIKVYISKSKEFEDYLYKIYNISVFGDRDYSETSY